VERTEAKTIANGDIIAIYRILRNCYIYHSNSYTHLYSKEQASAIKQAFWKTFGQYMSLHLSADSLKINWINYKTGIKHLAFKMDADNHTGCIMIEISHPDTGIQELMFEQFAELRPVLENITGEAWHWQLHTTDNNGKTVSRIITCSEGVHIFNQDEWPALISFFKPRLLALDEFWSVARYHFDMFR